MHRADIWTRTRVGRREIELAREWRVETNWEIKEPKQPNPALAQNGTAWDNEEAAVAWTFQRRHTFVFVHEIVMFSSGINS